MSQALISAELAGLVFWLLSLLFLHRAGPTPVLLWHLVGAGLSFVAPVLAAAHARDTPAGALLLLCLLAAINGMLGVLWCQRVEPAVSKLPMLAFALAGFGLCLLLSFMASTPSSLF